MCGIAGIFGVGCQRRHLDAMVASQQHRGPDDHAVYLDPRGLAGLGHNRLSILDLSAAGRQPMFSSDRSLAIVFNGEIYNYRELRNELSDYPYRTATDTEVILAAYRRWGTACLDRLVGMFALLLWDERHQRLWAVRDRFGVKPLYYHKTSDGTLLMASELRALHAAEVPSEPDAVAWASYLRFGLYDHADRTFWRNIRPLPAGHQLTWQDGQTRITRWYDLADRIGADEDQRPLDTVQQEYRELLTESIRLRFRSDVPVGINLSGGLDSSTLLGAVQNARAAESEKIHAFTFATGDDRYDELPWVRDLLAPTRHPWNVCYLRAEAVPALAGSVQAHQDEPFGGLPTLAYAQLFTEARDQGVIVLLDGQGMDEQWAGYDYYLAAADSPTTAPGQVSTVQGTRQSTTRPDCLLPEFAALAEPLVADQPFDDTLRNLQYRDLFYTKLPRALRFNDRISMRASVELREPFLDHRLVELAVRQPHKRKIAGGTGKWMLRQVASRLLPGNIVEAPKRPLQTPQREWLRGPLRGWAAGCIETALEEYAGTWLDEEAVRRQWQQYLQGTSDNSFYVWQWISLALHCRAHRPGRPSDSPVGVAASCRGRSF